MPPTNAAKRRRNKNKRPSQKQLNKISKKVSNDDSKIDENDQENSIDETSSQNKIINEKKFFNCQ